MDEYSCLGDKVNCYSMAVISLGKKAVVSPGAYLCTGTHDYEDPTFQLYAKPIHVGENAWICTEVFVGPGVNIGEGAVIGARSVVVKDVSPWTVCAGNPCRAIKTRVIKQTATHSIDEEID